MKYFLVRVWNHLVLNKILVFFVKQRFTIKPSKKQQRINVPFLHYATQCIFIHIVIHIPEYPNLTYIPHNDDTLRPNPTKPKNFNSIWGYPHFRFYHFHSNKQKKSTFCTLFLYTVLLCFIRLTDVW